MKKYILILLLINTFLYSDNIEKTKDILIVKQCSELYDNYLYYNKKSKNENMKEISKRWKFLANDYMAKYKKCATYSIDNPNIKEEFFRVNPYQELDEK